ncbi:hypothetical protein AAY473_014464, partial [Plecturocebus cupreus]
MKNLHQLMGKTAKSCSVIRLEYSGTILAHYNLPFLETGSGIQSPRLECSGTILTHCRFKLLASRDPPSSASQTARIIGMSHGSQSKPLTCSMRKTYLFGFQMSVREVGSSSMCATELLSLIQPKIETGFHHISQAGRKLLTSGDLRTSHSQSIVITGAGLQWHDCNLHLPGSSNSPASASPVTEIICACHYGWLILVFLVETGFCHVGQAGLELLTSSDLPATVSQSAGITGMSHGSWLSLNFQLKLLSMPAVP